MNNQNVTSFYLNKKRFWEIDFFRGIAIIVMICLHVIWAMDYFDFTRINFYEGGIFLASRSTAAFFLLLVGICLTISHSKTKEKVVKKYVWRGLKLVGCGMFITLVSLFLPQGGTVVFGILHLIGLSIIFAIPFMTHKQISLLTGLTAVILGLLIKTVTLDSPWLVWLGLTFPGFYSIDYFPVLPWFGFVLIGIFIGNTVYREGKRIFKLRPAPPRYCELICMLGRHSLIIYFLHMVVILTIIGVILYI